jgi:hypothetical protein
MSHCGAGFQEREIAELMVAVNFSSMTIISHYEVPFADFVLDFFAFVKLELHILCLILRP